MKANRKLRPGHMRPPMPPPPEMGPGPRDPHGCMRPPRPPMSREHILRVLLDYEDGVRQKQLVSELHIGAPAMSEAINKLESDGYISRRIDPDDKRATLISLTDLGRARAYEVQDEMDEHIAGLFGTLTEDEKLELIALLDKLLEDNKEA